MPVQRRHDRRRETPWPPQAVPGREDQSPGRPASADSPETLRIRLAEVRRDGTALTDWASVNGLRVLAAPVLDRGGHAIAALSVAAPAMRLSAAEFAAAVRAPLLANAGGLRLLARLVASVRYVWTGHGFVCGSVQSNARADCSVRAGLRRCLSRVEWRGTPAGPQIARRYHEGGLSADSVEKGARGRLRRRPFVEGERSPGCPEPASSAGGRWRW
jgi:hypothetical protein